MNALNKVSIALTIAALLMGACSRLPAASGQSDRNPSIAAVYETVLDKPLTDEVVANFITGNDCSSANQFLLCRAAGIALWTDSNQVVDSIYLYLNNAEGFAPYNGELPYGLKFYDTMASVEYKLARQGIGKNGLPDAGATPDRMHYRATYQQAGLTIIYNYPGPDEGATINAIVITIRKQPR
jgi:hypothetical protein